MFRSLSKKKQDKSRTPQLAIQQFKEDPKYNLNAVQKNSTLESFNFRMGTNIVDQSDPTLAWSYNVPILLQNEKSLLLKTQAFQICLLNFIGQQFPGRIQIRADNVIGSSDFTGKLTNTILSLQLIGITTHQENGILARDLIYKNQIQNVWQLGSLRELKLRIYVDNQPTPVSLPTINDFTVNFKIIHTSM